MRGQNLLHSSVIALLVFRIATISYAQYPVQRVPVADDADDNHETAIALDPTSDWFLIGWKDYEQAGPHPGWGFSDGGDVWETGILEADPRGPDPSVSYNVKYGAFYFCYFRGGADWNGPVEIQKTTDRGSFWTTYEVNPEDDFNQEDHPYMAVDNTGGSLDGNIYVTWTSKSHNGLWFRRPTNGGGAWNQRKELAQGVFPLPAGGVPAVGPGGELYVAYLDADEAHTGSRGQIKIRKSADGGATFAAAITAIDLGLLDFPRYRVVWHDDFAGTGSIRSSSLPTIAVNSANGDTVYVAAIAKGLDTGNIDILFTRSTNGGVTWEFPPRIATEYSDYLETFPWLSVDELGSTYLAYYTDRHDPGNKVDLYIARSVDRGASFETPDARVTVASSDPREANNKFDYIGVTSRGGFAYPSWVQFDGNADV